MLIYIYIYNIYIYKYIYIYLYLYLYIYIYIYTYNILIDAHLDGNSIHYTAFRWNRVDPSGTVMFHLQMTTTRTSLSDILCSTSFLPTAS